MEKVQILDPSQQITEEEPMVQISTPDTLVPQTPTPLTPQTIPIVKPKRVASAAQKLNYLKANARRLEILSDAKAHRVAAAAELKANQDAINEYELALRLATKYGFNTQQPPKPTPAPIEEVRQPEPPQLRYQMQPPARPPESFNCPLSWGAIANRKSSWAGCHFIWRVSSIGVWDGIVECGIGPQRLGWSRWSRGMGWGWPGLVQVMLASQKVEFEKSKKCKEENLQNRQSAFRMRKASQIASGYATIPLGLRRHEMKKRVRLGVDESASTLAVCGTITAISQRTSMSQSGPNTTRALANARAPRIRRRQTPSASVSPAFVRPANYRQMPARTPARNPRTQPVQTGPAFVRPAHYRRMQDHMEMPARLEMLGDIFLDVFNTPPPRINRGNLFTSVGPPDKNFRLPTSSAGMDRLYNQLMLQGRKIDRVFSETHSQTPIHRTWTLNTYMAYFKERDIDVDHQGAVRYLAKAADSKWKSLDLTGPQRPILDKGFAYDITVETIVSTSSGLRSYGTFLRSARITVNRPSDLETPILDCRFSPEESNANEENQQAHLAREMARHDATGSAISPPENDPFWIEADSWKTVFSSADTLVTFTQVVNITSGGSSSLADMRIATPKTIEYDNESIADTAESISDSEDDEPVDNPPEPIINCLIDIIRSRFTARIDEIENERLALPVGKTGRPKKGEVRDLTARRKRNMLNEHQKNIEARMNLLDKINERVVDEGGLQHGDDATLNEIVAASSAAFIQFICPLQQYREIYWRIDNPRVQNARENGVPRTGITAFLVSPVHVVNMDSGNWVFSSETVTKLNADQMRLKREELRAKGEMTLVTPSNNCKAGQLIRTLSGEVFAFHNEFSEWKKEFWDKQVNKSRMNTTQYDMPVISIIVASALLTGRARFQLYNEIASKYTVTEPHTCIVHKSIGNFDQKKAYTHAFDSINHRFMGSEGLCMGKIAESFLITNQQEMIDMLDASGIEGLLVIDQDSVDLTCINSIEMKKHFRNFDDNLDLSQLTDEKVADTIKRLYTINVVDKEETRLPRVLTFIEARFLIACGVTFTGLIALNRMKNMATLLTTQKL
ncbi:hypothetical protein T492DRAFT_1140269 [Pavlovales sp. CCMP2436]|nr:hypothetical protein T492DRAFT_1140269 [Pavlovales sp. CCMP2436]